LKHDVHSPSAVVLAEERKSSETETVTKPKMFTKRNCKGGNIESRTAGQGNSFARS